MRSVEQRQELFHVELLCAVKMLPAGWAMTRTCTRQRGLTASIFSAQHGYELSDLLRSVSSKTDVKTDARWRHLVESRERAIKQRHLAAVLAFKWPSMSNFGTYLYWAGQEL